MASPHRSKVNIEDLLSSLDEIPSIMTELKKQGSTASGSSSDDASRISAQASRVLQQLQRIATHDSYSTASPSPTISHETIERQPRPGSDAISLTQIQDALKGVSVNHERKHVPYERNQQYHHPDAFVFEKSPQKSHRIHVQRDLDPPNNTSLANEAMASQSSAAAIPLTAYEALARLAAMPQRRHYNQPISSPSSSASPALQRRRIYLPEYEEDLHNPVISVFDLAKSNPRDYRSSSANRKTRVSDLLAASNLLESDVWSANHRDIRNGRRFTHSKNLDLTNPYAHHYPSNGRSSSAPPRSSRPLKETLLRSSQSKERSTDDSNGFTKSSLSSALEGKSRRRVDGDSDAGSVSSAGSKTRRAYSSAKGFRTCAAPDKDEHINIDPAVVGQAENEIISQLSGSAGGLRRILKKADISRSGVLNYDDFRIALKKSGVHIDDEKVSALFFSNAQAMNNDHGYYGYTGGKALDIENFVTRVATRSSAPLFSHISGESRANAVRAAEEMRILKKVVHATNKQSDPMLVFRTLEPKQKRYITAAQFREGLKHIGAPLNAEEFQILMNRVDLDHDGRIDVGEYQTMLHSVVQESDKQAMETRKQALHQHHRYSNTYKSSGIVQSNIHGEFGHIRDSQVVRREDFRWSKLRAQLQRDKDAVLRAFSRTHGRGKRHVQPAGYAMESMSVSQLISRLGSEGVYFCPDDVERLQLHVDRAIGAERKAYSKFGQDSNAGGNEEAKLTIDTFCDIVGIPRAVNGRDEKIELMDPRYAEKDGGVFAASSKSLLGNPTFGTTYFISGEEDGPYVKGNTKRKIPQPQFSHHAQPHRFWELEQTANGPELMVSPIPSQREPYIVPNEIGTNRPMTNAQLRGRQNARILGQNVPSSNSTVGSDTASWALKTPFAVSGSLQPPPARAAKGRSHSAPPRTGSAVASLIHENPNHGIASTRTGVRSGDSVTSQGSGAYASSRSGSRLQSGQSRQPLVQMSLADLISTQQIGDGQRPISTLRRPPGSNTSSAALAIHGGPFATNY